MDYASDPMSVEARQSPRYALEAAVELRAGELIARGRTDNLSRGGMCVIVDRAIDRGAEVVASLVLIFDADTASEALDLPARVVWATTLAGDQHQLGIAFLGLEADQKNFLDMFLRYLEEGLAAREPELEDSTDDPEDPFAS